MKTFIRLLPLLLMAQPLSAAASRGLGVLSSFPNYCFVGDGIANNPTRVAEIRAAVTEFERGVNVRFNYIGKCPAPTKLANGNDDYGNSLRIRVSSSNTATKADGTIAGKGCAAKDPGSSFAMFPDEAAGNRACQWNSQIWDDADPVSGRRWTNHPLHEVGHALGLMHEHERSDATSSICNQAGFGGGWNTNWLTPYDKGSVMNYYFPNCGIPGNYGFTGLSASDILGLQILYPETGNPARYSGQLVVRQGQNVPVYGGWQWLGATANTAKNYAWTVNGAAQGAGISKSLSLGVGSHTVGLKYQDFLNRNYSASFIVKVLSAADFTKKVVAPVVASGL